MYYDNLMRKKIIRLLLYHICEVPWAPQEIIVKIILVKSDYFKMEQLTLLKVANKFYALVLTITDSYSSNVKMYV